MFKILSKKNIIIFAIIGVFYFFYTNVVERAESQKNKINPSSVPTKKPEKLIKSVVENTIKTHKTPNEIKYTHKELGNNEISPFPRELEMSGINSLHPKKPIDVYVNNIEQAKNGDDKSQYLVARSLRECSGIADNNDVENVSQQNIISEDNLQGIKAHSERCEEFLNYYTKEELNNWDTHYKWLIKSKNNGNNTAHSWHFQMNPDQYSKEQAYQIVIEGISSREQDDLLAYSAIQDYLVNFVPDSDVSNSIVELARCKVISWCDEEVIEAYIEHQETYYDANLIKEKSNAFADLIKSNNLEEIKKLLSDNWLQ